jgi:hypothetical protein
MTAAAVVSTAAGAAATAATSTATVAAVPVVVKQEKVVPTATGTGTGTGTGTTAASAALTTTAVVVGAATTTAIAVSAKAVAKKARVIPAWSQQMNDTQVKRLTLQTEMARLANAALSCSRTLQQALCPPLYRTHHTDGSKAICANMPNSTGVDEVVCRAFDSTLFQRQCWATQNDERALDLAMRKAGRETPAARKRHKHVMGGDKLSAQGWDAVGGYHLGLQACSCTLPNVRNLEQWETNVVAVAPRRIK